MSDGQRGKLPIVVLISGSGSNLQALIDAIRAQHIPAQIRAVISNRPEAFGLERARRAGITTAVLDHRAFADRQVFDAALQNEIDKYHPGLVVLAGFMRILGPDLVRHYEGRMLNIHPSLLPKYRGLRTHERALAAGDVEHGVSVHFVTTELDGGPVVLQARVPILPGDDAARLAARVLEQEHIIYPEAVRWFAEGRLTLSAGRAMLDGSPLTTQEHATPPALP